MHHCSGYSGKREISSSKRWRIRYPAPPVHHTTGGFPYHPPHVVVFISHQAINGGEETGNLNASLFSGSSDLKVS